MKKNRNINKDLRGRFEKTPYDFRFLRVKDAETFGSLTRIQFELFVPQFHKFTKSAISEMLKQDKYFCDLASTFTIQDRFFNLKISLDFTNIKKMEILFVRFEELSCVDDFFGQN